MRNSTRILVAAAVIVLFGTVSAVAVAASPHFKRGGTPVCTIDQSGGTATAECRGTLAGLGNQDLLINTTLTGFAVFQCQNQGGNIAPGQNRVLTGPTTTPTTIPAGAIKNGNVTFVATGTLEAPETVSGAEAGFPNPNWTGINPTLTVTDIELEIIQGGVVLFTCTASDEEGLSGRVALTC